MSVSAVEHSGTLLYMEQHSFSAAELATLLGVSKRTLQEWRASGRGPKFSRLGHSLVKYGRDDVMRWLRSNPPINTPKMFIAVKALTRTSINRAKGANGKHRAVGTGRKTRKQTHR